MFAFALVFGRLEEMNEKEFGTAGNGRTIFEVVSFEQGPVFVVLGPQDGLRGVQGH